MTRFPHLHAILTGEPSQAQSARQRAWEEHQQARARKDTRAIHETRQKLVRETHVELAR